MNYLTVHHLVEEAKMSVELQFAVGMVFGLIAGIAVGLVRPILLLLVVASVVAAIAIMAHSGAPGLVGWFGHLVRRVWEFASFFIAAAVGKVLGVAQAVRQ